MDIIKVTFTSLISLLVLFLLTKLSGNKQVAHLTMLDYVISITIGSIAAELSTELENPIKPLVAMLVFGLSSLFISVINQKSLKLRRLLFGSSIILMKNGKIYEKNLKSTKMDLSEFLMQARTKGYFDISSIDTAILEPSGNISFLPFSNKRSATPEDLNLAPQSDAVFLNVILDGVILEKNLKSAGFDRNWLENKLKANGNKVGNIFLATLDNSGNLNIFEKTEQKISNDFFQ